MSVTTFPEKLIVEDSEGEPQVLRASGVNNDFLIVIEAHSFLLREILTELRINNQYLMMIVGSDNTVTEDDIGGE